MIQRPLSDEAIGRLKKSVNQIEKDKQLERLRDEFAMHAPEVPHWFMTAYNELDSKELADSFFSWRWFYADQMILTREQKQ